MQKCLWLEKKELEVQALSREVIDWFEWEIIFINPPITLVRAYALQWL